MRPVVVHLTRINASTTLASARIARFLARTLGAPIADSAESLSELAATNSCVLLVNGPPAFCSFREELARFVRGCASLIFVQNDYTIYPPSQVNKVMRKRGWVDSKGHVRPPYTWTTIPHRLKDDVDGYVNWNALTVDSREWRGRREKSLMYYGAFRRGRREAFLRYLSPIDSLVISASAVAARNFTEALPQARIVKPFDDVVEAASMYRYGLYVHDDYSTRHYCSPANRFYEMLSAGMVIFVAEECVDTLEKAGYSVPPSFVVTDGHDLKRAIRGMDGKSSRYEWARKTQRAQWLTLARREHAELAGRVRDLARSAGVDFLERGAGK